MGYKMTWEEIKKAYPNEWVAVVNYTENAVGDVEGEVVLHSNDKNAFYNSAKDIVARYGGMAMRYTGALIKNEETPLLWQISPTV